MGVKHCDRWPEHSFGCQARRANVPSWTVKGACPPHPPPPLEGNHHLAQKASEIVDAEGAEENFSFGYTTTAAVFFFSATILWCNLSTRPLGGHFMPPPPPPRALL